MAPLHQPHDHLFRLVFAAPEETAAVLRARLPDSYQRGILWSSLRRAAGSFVDQDLRGSVSGGRRAAAVALSAVRTSVPARPLDGAAAVALLLPHLGD